MSMEEPQYIEYYYRNSEEWLLLPNDPWIQRCLSSPEAMTFEDSSRFANVIAKARACTGLPLWEAIDEGFWTSQRIFTPDEAASIIQRNWLLYLKNRPPKVPMKLSYDDPEGDLIILKAIWEVASQYIQSSLSF